MFRHLPTSPDALPGPLPDPLPRPLSRLLSRPRLHGAFTVGFGLLAATCLATAALMDPRVPDQGQAPGELVAAAVDPDPIQHRGGTPLRFDPRRFVLNALLAPALDPDADPATWADPRPVMACGSASSIRIDGLTLSPGTPVPAGRFIVDWDAHQCRPFGLEGPRVDGSARLIIDRVGDAWTAVVLPAGMAFTLADGHSLPLMAGRARMPAAGPADRLLAGLTSSTETGGRVRPGASTATPSLGTQP